MYQARAGTIIEPVWSVPSAIASAGLALVILPTVVVVLESVASEAWLGAPEGDRNATAPNPR